MEFELEQCKEDLLHVKHYIILLWCFGQKLIYIERYLNMSCHLRYEHMMFNSSCRYVDIVQEIVNERANVNRKGQNENISFAFSMWKQPWWHLFDICMVLNAWYTILFLVFHKFYKCDFLQLCKYYLGVIYTKGKKQQMWKHSSRW